MLAASVRVYRRRDERDRGLAGLRDPKHREFRSRIEYPVAGARAGALWSGAVDALSVLGCGIQQNHLCTQEGEGEIWNCSTPRQERGLSPRLAGWPDEIE